jgi:hypothetical protein
MDIEKLDILLEELRLADSDAKSVDFNKFCNNKWGQTGQTFTVCDQIVRTLIADGYAEHPGVDKRGIRLTNSGRQFKGYAQTERDILVVAEDNKLIEELRKKNLILSNDKLEYEKTIRRLQEELTISSLFKNWWGLIVGAISLGVAIGKFLLS